METLLKYHIDETGKRFSEIRNDFLLLNAKVDDIRDFKIRLIASSRMTSLIVSGLCGLFTMIVTVLTTVKVMK